MLACPPPRSSRWHILLWTLSSVRTSPVGFHFYISCLHSHISTYFDLKDICMCVRHTTKHRPYWTFVSDPPHLCQSRMHGDLEMTFQKQLISTPQFLRESERRWGWQTGWRLSWKWRRWNRHRDSDRNRGGVRDREGERTRDGGRDGVKKMERGVEEEKKRERNLFLCNFRSDTYCPSKQ